MELLARDWDPPVRSARPCQVVPGWLQPRQNYMGDALGRQSAAIPGCRRLPAQVRHSGHVRLLPAGCRRLWLRSG